MARAEPAGGVAHARAALAGNPSDGYGGAVVALTLSGLRAQASAWASPELEVVPESDLVRAAVTRLAREHMPAATRTAVGWSTSIPRHVGLGGSSAIVIATLRAVCSLHGISVSSGELASLALAVEVEDLGIAAGLQDRFAQAYGGLIFMDFAPWAGPHAYESLDESLLPPVLVAWRESAGGDSGAVHAPLRDRHASGEPAVLHCLGELAALARGARAALLAGDRAELARCVDGSFEARRRMLALDPRHTELIECARVSGASANYTGSGGAIVAVCPDQSVHARAARALRAIGCQTL
jgi:glucuronokinase